MRRVAVVIPLLLLAGCGGGEASDERAVQSLSRNPVSVRGWITDVKGATRVESPELEIARRTELFATAAVWVEDTRFASGGIAGNGAFVVLDVPPQSATIGFNAPGAENARIVLQNVPSSADVLIPDVVLEPGGATVLDPKAIQVRIPGTVSGPRPTGRTATVAGYTVPVVEAPLSQFADRRDYPNPGGFRPIAIVK